jgi:hypothetical protein
LDASDVSSEEENTGSLLDVSQKYPCGKICEYPQEHELNTSGKPDAGKAGTSGLEEGTRKPTGVIQQGGGCLSYDVGVLYIFVEGEYVGEAYCPQLMGGRVSEWEARAMRKHDAEQEKQTNAQALPVRARIQNEAGTPRRRSRDLRASEQARQWDRQRQDIHPAEVIEHLARIETKKVTPATLPPAVPDADDARPVRVLPIRMMREEPQP